MLSKLFLTSNKQTIFRHLAAWLSIVIYYILFSTIQGSSFVKFIWIFLLIINYSSTYYTLVLFIWPKIISEKKFLYSVLIIFIIVFFCSFFYFQLTVITPWIGGIHPMIDWPFNEFINNALKLFSYILFTSLGTYYNWQGIKKIEEDIKVERGIIEMEVHFLKNQFHSHLTFNFLNFCYNKIRGVSLFTANSIEGFAEMLRYSLITPSEATVLLEKEIEYIENYISFQKFLIPNLNVQFSYKHDLADIYILPKIFGGLVEYFFKNSSFYNTLEPAIISIESTQNEITLTIKNKKKDQNIFMRSEELQNTEQILQSFYSNKYFLQILDNDNLFSCELKLEIYKSNNFILDSMEF
jgi:two-component system LytT family sensor kinase